MRAVASSGAETAVAATLTPERFASGLARLRGRLSREMVAQLFTALAAVSVAFAGVLAGWLNLRLRLGIDSQDRFVTFVSLAGAILFFCIRAPLGSRRDFDWPRHRAFLRDLEALAIAAALFAALTYLAQIGDLFARGWMLSWWVLAALALGTVRFAFYGAVSSVLKDLTRRRVALVGSPDLVASARSVLARSGEEIEIAAEIAVPKDGGLDQSLERLRQATPEAGIDEIVLCLPLAEAEMVRRAVDVLLAVPAEVSLLADRAGVELAAHGFPASGELPRIRLLERPDGHWGAARERFV